MPDRYVSSLATGTGDGTVGNPFTLAQACALSVTDRVFVKADGIYQGQFTWAAGTYYRHVIGYQNTIWDGVRPTIRANTGGANLFISNGSGQRHFSFDNLNIETAGSGGIAFEMRDGAGAVMCPTTLRNIVVNPGFSTTLRTFPNCRIQDSYIAGGPIEVSRTGNQLIQNIIIDRSIFVNSRPISLRIEATDSIFTGGQNGIEGTQDGGSWKLTRCVLNNHTEASVREGYIINNEASEHTLDQCVIANSTSRLKMVAAFAPGSPTPIRFRNCFFWNVATGTSQGVAPVLINSSILTADPFENAASLNFRINNVAGGGALIRASGFNLPITNQAMPPMGNWYTSSSSPSRSFLDSLIKVT